MSLDSVTDRLKFSGGFIRGPINIDPAGVFVKTALKQD
jgi:hypothetical protein